MSHVQNAALEWLGKRAIEVTGVSGPKTGIVFKVLPGDQVGADVFHAAENRKQLFLSKLKEAFPDLTFTEADGRLSSAGGGADKNGQGTWHLRLPTEVVQALEPAVIKNQQALRNPA